MRDAAQRLDRRQDRLAGAHHLDREEMAQRRRRAAGPRHHPRSRLGRAGEDAASDDWPGMEGKVFYVWFDAPIEYIAATAEWAEAHGRSGCRLGTLVAHRQGRRRRALRPVHGQGQRALPHALLPGHDHGLGRAVEAGRLHQELQLPQLRRRPVLHLAGPRRVHGPGAGDPAGRLLALVAAAATRRRTPTASSPGKTSRSRSTRTSPTCWAISSAASPSSAARNSARRCRPAARLGPAEEALIADLTARIADYEALMDAMEVRKSGDRAARDLGRGQRIPAERGPLVGVQGRPRRGRRDRPARC